MPFIREIDDLNLPKNIYDDIMGNNTARLFGFMEKEVVEDKYQHQGYDAPTPIVTKIKDRKGVKISQFMAVRAVAEAFPETRAVFEKYQIPWKDSPVPFWEPIAQAAAAKRMGPKARQHMVDELNDSIKQGL
jgi:hypothetical protein